MESGAYLPQCEVLSCGYSYHTSHFNTPLNAAMAFYLFRLQTEGKSRALLDGDLKLVEAGELTLFKPGDPYELEIDDEPSGDYFLMCRGEWVDGWWQRSPKPNRVRLPLHEGILTVWRQLNIESAKQRASNKELLDYYLRILCLHIERHIEEQVSYPAGANAYLAYRIKHYIEINATQPLTLDQVASHAGLSVSRTVHLFKAVFGQSVMQHIIETRLALAKERILYSSLTLEQIAESCGYGSYSYFHRMFRSRFGISPKVFRQRGR